jgi:PAS domain-containing protein
MLSEKGAQATDGGTASSWRGGSVLLALVLLVALGAGIAIFDRLQFANAFREIFLFALGSQLVASAAGLVIAFAGLRRFSKTVQFRPLLLGLTFSLPTAANIFLATLFAWLCLPQVSAPTPWYQLASFISFANFLVAVPLATGPLLAARFSTGRLSSRLGRRLFLPAVALGLLLTAGLIMINGPSAPLNTGVLEWFAWFVLVLSLSGAGLNCALTGRYRLQQGDELGLILFFVAGAEFVTILASSLGPTWLYLSPLLMMCAYITALFSCWNKPQPNPIDPPPLDRPKDSFLEACLALTKTHGRPDLLEILADDSLHLTSADFAILSALDEEGRLQPGPVKKAGGQAEDAAAFAEFLYANRREIRGATIERGEALHVESLSGEAARGGWPVDFASLRSFLAVPLVLYGLPAGFVGLASLERTLTEADRATVTGLCSIVGLEIERLDLSTEIEGFGEEVARTRHELENQYLSRLDELENTLESLPEALVVIGLDGKIVRHNQAAEEILGRQIDEGRLVPADSWRFWQPMDFHGRRLSLRETPLGGALFDGRVSRMLLRPGGTSVEDELFEMNAAPLREKTGKTCGAVATFHRPLTAGKPAESGAPVLRLKTAPTTPEATSPTVTSLVDLVVKVAEERQATTNLHRIKVRSQLPKPTGRWNEEQLTQVVRDLLRIAIDRNPDGGDINVLVRQKGSDAEVVVKDYGLGRFLLSQIDSPTVGRLDVYGESVATLDPELLPSREIVVAQGGKMWAEDSLEDGARVIFTLPVLEEPQLVTTR